MNQEPPNAVLVDLDGVLYKGDEVIPGAVAAVEWLQSGTIPHLFLTNTTSRPRRKIAQKLEALGMEVDEDSILTPVIAARHWLHAHIQGEVALFMPEATKGDLGDIDELPRDRESGAAALILGDLGEGWDFATLNRAFRLLMTEPRPALIALGMTRYWRAPDGLRLDVAPFVKALEHATGCEAIVLGKPAKEFFGTALALIQSTPGVTVMIGDDITTDVQGAQQAGLAGVLVRTGKFRPADLDGPIRPDAVLDTIGDLPAWWRTMTGGG
ncbi:MAG: TIGR01458 family HAD-type hydrolase [Gammaproteobacteria bacterium]|jgi:phospholysine phosphohistidine inorganic pyrophosphate phosphatase